MRHATSGLRQLRTAKAHSAVVILTLAIGVVGATAMAGVLRGVLLRPLPYASPGELVTLGEFHPDRARDHAFMSLAALQDTRAEARSFAGMAGFSYSELVLSGTEAAERVIGAAVEVGALDVLGVRPLLGRRFLPGEDGAAPAPVAIISYRLWLRRFHGDSAVLNRSIVVDGAATTIIGVMGPDFEFPRTRMMAEDCEIWVPLGHSPQALMRRGRRNLTVVARLRPGVSLTQASADLERVGASLAGRFAGASEGWSIRGTPLKDYMVGDVRPALLMLGACVGVLALLVSINAAAALLSRTIQRRQMLAVRAALGAGRRSLVAMLLAEAATLGLAAGVVAMPASAALQRILLRIAPEVIPRREQIHWDTTTLLIALGGGLALSLLAALASLTQLRGLDASQLHEGGRAMVGGRAIRRGLTVLVVAQLALATMLAGLSAGVYSGYRTLHRIDPGFTSADVLTATLALAGPRYQMGAARTLLTEQYLERVRALPGVSHAAVVSLLPLSGGLMSAPFTVAGTADGDSSVAALRAVSADYFATLSIPLRLGRPIDRTDDAAATPVVVVNESLVRQRIRTGSPIGATLRVAGPGMDSITSFRVVGVVGDTKERNLTGPAMPMVYFSNRQTSFPHSVLVVQSGNRSLVPSLRASLAAIDPSLALDDVGSLADKVSATYALQRFYLVLLGAFGVCAAALVAVGVYGLVNSVVSAESKAIAIRLALGATSPGILLNVLGRTAKMAGAGCGVGVVASLMVQRAGRSGLVAVEGLGGMVPLLGGIGILVVALVASSLPAMRASRSAPADVLKE